MHNIARLATIFLVTISAGLAGCSSNKTGDNKTDSLHKANLTLPTGFTATIIADSLGPVRHLAVNKQGDIYVKLNSLRDGKGICFLSDTNHDGMLDKRTGFAGYPGTGV